MKNKHINPPNSINSPLGSEKSSVQNPLIYYVSGLSEKYDVQNNQEKLLSLGWEYIKPEDAEKLRGGRNCLILKEIFTKQILKLNSDFIDNQMIEELIKKIELLPSTIEGNFHAWEYLKGIKTVYVTKEKRERNVKLIDSDPEKNLFHVTDEFTFANGRYTNRFDIVFLINGIPIFFVETKASHKLGAIAEALDQVKRYHNETPEAMTMLQVYTLTDVIQFYYSATWNVSTKLLFNWKAEAKETSFEKLVKDFFDKKRVVRTVLDYILFTRKDDELQKVVLRPHQMRAINKVVERVADKDKHRGLIWHTQGSGKTYTMIVAAQKIIENPLFENPTVIMLVDRNELESQLFSNLKAIGIEYLHIAESKRHLKELLKRDSRGLIVSMIHKFEKMPANIITRNNVFVLVDEAHRTTGRDLGNYLMGALPNATYIGFTGTPIDKTNYGSGTFIIFGKDDPPKGYLDKYGISESIEDGTTVKLHYALASNELLPDTETLEREFLNLKEAEGISDIETLNNVLKKAVHLKNMLKNQDRIKKVTAYIVDHYKNYVEPLGYKAFIVAVDREACALYKEELDKHLPEEYSKVIYSPFQNDEELLKKYYLSEEEEKRIRKAFTKPDQMPKILIVTEKLLTGFDAPILYCMYLDKPMRDHVLLQAIARVNRPYEDERGIKKPCGFILDFVGIFGNLKKALAFDSQDISEVVKDVETLKDKFKEMMEIAKQKYLSIIKNLQADKATEAILTHFKDETEREEFYKFYYDLANIYEILSPDAFLRPYIDDYDTLSRMLRIIREAYEPSLLDVREFTKKTEKLVQEHTKVGKLNPGLTVYEINKGMIKKIRDRKDEYSVSDIEIIFNLMKSIDKVVTESVNDNPYLLSISERAKEISELFKKNQQNSQETIKNLIEIVEDIDSAKTEREKKNMSSDVFAIYWYLSKEKIPDAEIIANDLGKLFDEYPHWKINEEHERKIRKEFNKMLLNRNVELEKTTEIVKKLINILREAKR